MAKKKIKKFTIINFKGGTGKTSLACAFAQSLNYGVVTNDSYSPLERVLEEKNLIKLDPEDEMPVFPPDLPIIFDLGGHIDSKTISAIKQSDCLIVSVFNDFLNLKVTMECLNEITQLHKNIVVVANKTTGKDFEEIKAVVGEFFPEIPVFNLKQSKAFVNIFKNQMSLEGMMEAGGLQKHAYKAVFAQYKTILKHITN